MPKTIIPKELKLQAILHDKNTHVLSKNELNNIFDIDKFNELDNELEYQKIEKKVLKKYKEKGYTKIVDVDKTQQDKDSPIFLKMTLAKNKIWFFKKDVIIVDETIFPCWIKPERVIKYPRKIPKDILKKLVLFKNKFRLNIDDFGVLSLQNNDGIILGNKRLLVYWENHVDVLIDEWNEKT